MTSDPTTDTDREGEMGERRETDLEEWTGRAGEPTGEMEWRFGWINQWKAVLALGEGFNWVDFTWIELYTEWKRYAGRYYEMRFILLGLGFGIDYYERWSDEELAKAVALDRDLGDVKMRQEIAARLRERERGEPVAKVADCDALYSAAVLADYAAVDICGLGDRDAREHYVNIKRALYATPDAEPAQQEGVEAAFREGWRYGFDAGARRATYYGHVGTMDVDEAWAESDARTALASPPEQEGERSVAYSFEFYGEEWEANEYQSGEDLFEGDDEEQFCPDCADEDWSDIRAPARQTILNPCEKHEVSDIECCPVCLMNEVESLRAPTPERGEEGRDEDLEWALKTLKPEKPSWDGDPSDDRIAAYEDYRDAWEIIAGRLQPDQQGEDR